ncbi:MazG-like nucleotide pyrophosphohydrolase [Microbacterium phage GaeCeo]|nr:MazG-like nucleotide pyrophosphohydrolase [Microbacterium phage GaeCeo]
MTIYKKKNATVEAQRFDVAKVDDLVKWTNGTKVKAVTDVWWVVLGPTTAVPGDYIVKTAHGFKAMKPADFEQTYEIVGGTHDHDYVLARAHQAAEEAVEESSIVDHNSYEEGYLEGFHHGVSTPRGLNVMQEAVRKFQEGMRQPVALTARPLPADRIPVRIELIREEFEDELIPALHAGDMVETADACIDILYVTFGLLVEMGIDAQPLFDEVQRSNMSKFGADGQPIIAGPNDPDGVFEGRVKKGPNYFRPNLKGILLNDQAHLGG